MKIDRVRIQGYRSLDDLELCPRDFTVLVGPNNSGKSNIVDALDFLAEVYRNGVKLAVDRKGGFENIAFQGRDARRTKISFQVEASVGHADLRNRIALAPGGANHEPRSTNGQDAVLHIEHQFSILAKDLEVLSDFEVDAETIQIEMSNPLGRQVLLRGERQGEESSFDYGEQEVVGEEFLPAFIWDFEKVIVRGLFDVAGEPLSLLADKLRSLSPAFRYFTGHMMATQVYQLAPLECRGAAAPGPTPALGAYGENLPALVYHMEQHFPWSWARVMQNMALVVPELESIRVRHTYDRLLTLEFAESGVGRPWTSKEVSDGTIRTLALFTTLYDPRSSMVAIEEPENSVHPWIVRVFVDVSREASNRESGKQIIVTTHSPALINYLAPEEVLVVWRDEQRTKVSPLVDLDPDARGLWEQGRASLFDMLDSGLLRQAVPTTS